MRIRYSLKQINENMAKAYGRDLSISTKKSVEICRAVKGKKVEKAKTYLEKVVEKKQAVPMKRYNRDTAHKKEIAAGKYPIKAAEAILKIVKNAEANAQNKGLSTKDLIVYHISAHKAATPWRFGRQRRRKMKRSHIEVVLLEKKQRKVEEKKDKK
jgi:large subunit ribosomal protein L22